MTDWFTLGEAVTSAIAGTAIGLVVGYEIVRRWR